MSKYASVIVGIVFCVFGPHLIGEETDVASNWHHFRGPTTNGISQTAKPPTSWSSSENVAWKIEMPGKGSSSPIIWGEKLFLTAAVSVGDAPAPARMNRDELREKFDKNKDGQLDDTERQEAMKFIRAERQKSLREQKLVVMCFDRNTGEKIWEDVAIQRKPLEGTHRDGSYAAASPFTDGEHVYFNFGSMGLYCYDLAGKQIWKRTDLGEMQMRGSFGEGSSVAVEDGLLILPWDHEGQSKIEAINKETGETVWKKDRDEPSAWSTPKIVSINGKKQIIHSGENYCRGYDLKTGEELWKASGLSTRPVASPVAKGNVGFFASSRQGSVLNAFALDGTGDISSNALWKIDRQTPDCPSLLLSDNRIFYISANQGIVSCANSDDGSLFFGAERLSGMNGCYSSPVAADGKVFVTGRGGKTFVLADDEEFKLISHNDIGEGVDATLALAGDQIFIRGSKHLFCIQEKK